MKKTLLLVAVLLIFSVGTAFAGDLDVDVKCPGSVKVSTPLNVTVDMYGYGASCSSVDVNRFMLGLVGNGAGTLGNAGLWGPYQKYIAAVSVPSCSETPLTKTLTIINSTPTELVNTMAMVMVIVMDSKGRERTSGSCMVAVVP
jgi:hypothetical protein